LAYPQFLFAIGVMVSFIITGEIAVFAAFMAVVATLELIRPQLAIFYPVIALIIFADFWRRRSARAAVLQAALLAVTVLLTSGIFRLANLVEFGRFASGQFSGLTLSVLPFYVAEDRDYNFTPMQAELFRRVRAAMRARGIGLGPGRPRDSSPVPLGYLVHVRPDGGPPTKARIPTEVAISRHIYVSYDYLAFGLIYCTALHLIDPTALAGTPEGGEVLLRRIEANPTDVDDRGKIFTDHGRAFDLHVQMAGMLTHMAIELIRTNALRYAMVYGLTIVDGLHGRAPTVIFLALCAIAVLGFLRHPTDAALAVSAVFALHGANLLGHAPFVPLAYRYLFNTEILYFLVIALGVWHLVSAARVSAPNARTA